MKEDLIRLIDQTDEIQMEFRHFTPEAGVCIPSGDFIYDVPEFIEWKQSVEYELQDIYDRTHDTYVWKMINATGVLNQFDGHNYDEPKNFEILKSSLKVIRKNIDKYYSSERSHNDTRLHGDDKMKPTKVFISHSSDDIKFVSPLVELLADIGLTNDNLFCSSVPDYGIPLGQNIYDYLSDQFRDYNLFVIFVLSKNYYKSPACLNEMGAAWVLKNSYISILVPGFAYQEIKGAVNPNNISMKLDESEDFLKKYLEDLKTILMERFSLSIPTGRWEKKRNDFISEILSLQNSL